MNQLIIYFYKTNQGLRQFESAGGNEGIKILNSQIQKQKKKKK
jgi:hypothetical protein